MKITTLRNGLLAALVVVVSAAPSPAAPAKKPTPAAQSAGGPLTVVVQPRLDPKAIDILKAASARLAAANTMSFTAAADYESPSLLGPPLVYTTMSEVDAAAARQAARDHVGRRPANGVLLRRQDDDGVGAGGEPGRGRRRAADDRGGAEGRLRSAAIYFPFADLWSPTPTRDIAERTEARVLHRPVEHRRRHHHRHGRIVDDERLRADLDRRRRQAAARGCVPCTARSGRLRQELDLSDWLLTSMSGGHLRIAEGGDGEADHLRPPRSDSRPACSADQEAPKQPAR